MMDVDTMKVELDIETCCICNSVSEELFTPEEYDAGAPPAQAPLRSMLLHINNNKTVPSGRMCAGCISRAVEAYNFSSMLVAKGPPPLSDKIRALRQRLYALSQKIDVFIVVGGGGGAGGGYRSEDIILVERAALADVAAPAAHTDSRGDRGYQCSRCPAFFKRGSEYSSHTRAHGETGPHSCWECGAQFATRAALDDHHREHGHSDSLRCHLCRTTFESAGERGRHSCPAECPVCGRRFPSAEALRGHAAAHPQLCAACFLVLPSAESRAAHALSHARASRFLCATDGCILRFDARADLLSHIRKFHGEPAPAPAACAACDRTFATAAALRRHARLHAHRAGAHLDLDGGR